MSMHAPASFGFVYAIPQTCAHNPRKCLRLKFPRRGAGRGESTHSRLLQARGSNRKDSQCKAESTNLRVSVGHCALENKWSGFVRFSILTAV